MIRSKNIVAYLIAALMLVQPAVAISVSREFAKKKTMIQQMKHDIKCALKGDASAEQWARIGVAAVGTAAVIVIGGTAVFYGLKIKAKNKKKEMDYNNKPKNDYEKLLRLEGKHSRLTSEEIETIIDPRSLFVYKGQDNERSNKFLNARTTLLEAIEQAKNLPENPKPIDYLDAYSTLDDVINTNLPIIKFCYPNVRLLGYICDPAVDEFVKED